MSVSSPLPRPSRGLLSNGNYSVMLSAAGAGFSRWRGMAVTRWREDPTRDAWGSYLLLRDEESGSTWSPTQQPYGTTAATEAVSFESGRASFRRDDGELQTAWEVAVASDTDVELRILTLHNRGQRARMLSVTSYAELVLGPIGADEAHPAFSKMFVQTEWDEAHHVLLATRRRRADSEPEVWAAHALQVEGQRAAAMHETDRALFLGRGRSLRDAWAMQPGAELSNTTGCVLDPVFSVRQPLALAPGATVRVLCWTRLADTRAGALALAAQLKDAGSSEQLVAAAMQYAEALRRRCGIDAVDAARLDRWTDALLVSDPRQQAEPDMRARGQGGPPSLWPAGISGDRPLILACIGDTDDLPRIREALAAQNYLRHQQLAIDVVVLNTATDGDMLQHSLDAAADAQRGQLKTDGGLPKAELFVLRDDAIEDSLRNALFAVARVVLGKAKAPRPAANPAPSSPSTIAIRGTDAAFPAEGADAEAMEFANGTGGFVEQGRAYRIAPAADQGTPAPWVNVIANPVFGFLVSAEGGGYTWSINSQQNPLTPWPNDPVSDAPHDVLYLRDEDSGALWSATAAPIHVIGAAYVATHGKGWSRFACDAHGIGVALTQFVPTADPVKLSRLRLVNRSDRMRRLSVTGYVEWALGANGTVPAPFVVTARDEATGALLARNPWRPDFGGRVAFFDMGGQQQSMSGDRAGFLGALGDTRQPAALHDGAPLSGRLGAGLDPCGALQACLELPPHTQIELVFALGDAASEAEARSLIARYRDADLDAVLADVAAQWIDVLDTVQVRTPDRAMDILLNDWLLYQVLACRLWARTAYYQASGAYGFRDQLQDVMALCVSRPDLAREHLLRAAGRQFAEGDVQHWWLPPKGQGIRTKISDDRVWLAYVAMHYVAVSGDHGVLDETLPFLAGQSIPAGASDAFFQPAVSDQQATVYEHCARALDSSLTRGAHGLPLMGTGDWNDGMNAVGENGRGESGWLGWFLLATIDALAPCAEKRGDAARVQRWRAYADDLRAALERAWDGAWYRRGYYDDGMPLGSREDDECRIDSIAQSWSVIAGAADRDHARTAMLSNESLLVDRANGISRLFTPPFDNGAQKPGYIKGYPPGVRENGGQYTHGATWSIFAWAQLGDGDRAAGLFDLLNPIRHSADAEAAARYKVEPYVVSADVYSVDPHVGRGGWTWYTGSAAWLYRAGLEAVLGFQLRGDRLRIDPCIPKAWPGFALTFQYRVGARVTRYEIAVENPGRVCGGVALVEMDGRTIPGGDGVRLVDDGGVHALHVVLGS
jgi:cyclic beta-1,2-glucan synthetase